MSDRSSRAAQLERLIAGQDLSGEEADALMRGWIAQEIDPVVTGALLTALRCKGLSGEELAAMAAVLRQHCDLPAPRPELPLIDTCGTGGAGFDSFNISTAVAFTAAACGAHVAKHGNRSASGRVGSADVLEALGLPLGAPQERVIAAVERTGVTFLFAPGWHPALVGLVPLRRALGIRTVFNLLGPLVNPLRPDAHVLGVARPDLLDPMAEALRRLGQGRAIVVHGHGGLDEATLSGPSELRLLENGEIRSDRLDPAGLGLALAPLSAIAGGDLEENRRILEQVLQGQAAEAHTDVVALNAALVLWVAGRSDTIAEGLEQARASLAAGDPWQRLLALREALAEPAGG
ncbi:anthranilate phosphoribosyltransferase [Synechococcus sp. CBW1004]|jgi:anthranilate phosphoribosyltransferase|uniref:anthranilate phosphoribosyltransferase n=1 Tax=Synechococcus sp. CBW1004 TaxID=1353136 RepID=UPI0018CFD1D6|nr:anthranilate phosphoribosyltransferase [Synechococcus sp. CBW1004]QPN64176.1 anthranilate phosphoribosyltransferase [Synechococcus sp. CBW1004]